MTSRYSPPPIMKAIERLLGDIEEAVGVFVRRHRYVIGEDLRRQAMRVFHLANKACRDRDQQARWVGELIWAIDDLKQYLRTAKLINATRSFRQFEHLIRQMDAVGMQAGGWKRQLHPKAQSAQACHAQRGQKLSTRDASHPGANP